MTLFPKKEPLSCSSLIFIMVGKILPMPVMPVTVCVYFQILQTISRRPLSNIDIEEAMRLVIGIPDNDSSEDDLESLDGEEYNDEILRLVLEDETNSRSINLPPSQEVNPSIYDDPIPSNSSIQQRARDTGIYF